MDQPDFRALCAELLVAIQLYTGLNPAASEMSSVEITEKLMDAMAATAAALATPPPEPVAYIHRQGNYWEPSERVLQDDEKERGWTEEPLYAAPPPPEPLRPIPVSERLPEAGEWVWHCYTGVRFWEHGRYYSRQELQPDRHWFFIGDGPESQPATHWLPANAIPFPEVTP